MNHYPHHIGDFDRATRHLTRLERSIYRDLMDMYYDTEAQLPLDVPAICRKIIARSNEESTAVEQVLNEFFTKTDVGYWHQRCESEIEAYRANNSQKALAGKASAAKKAAAKQQAINARSTAVETPLSSRANETTTASNGVSTNQEPEPISVAKATGDKSPPDPIFGTGLAFLVSKGLDQKLARSFLGKLRKDCNHDDLRVLRAIERAKAEDISDPVPWLTKALAPSAAPERKPWN